MNDDVKKLTHIAKDTLKNKEIDRLRLKLSERAQEIKDAQPTQRMDFFCSECERDFGGIGHKEVRWPKGSVWFAFYRGRCPEGHLTIRYITDKLKDPYFYKSPFVRKQQSVYADAMIGPDNPRFKVLYPEAYERIQQQKLKRELMS